MCGISGLISINISDVNIPRLKNMTDIISRRGTDGEGHWISENGAVGLGHRRLSIIDLSCDTNQPMHYLESYAIIYNGEIYNYTEPKEVLLSQGYEFRTSSDTEVLIALYHRYQEKCLDILDGMFSFVIYDKEKNEFFAARDRYGEKPFFYSYEKEKNLYLGSEIECLWAAGIPKETNNVMLYDYLENGFLSNHDKDCQTFYNNCTRLKHSHFLKLNVSNLELSMKKYDIDYAITDGQIDISKSQKKFQELFYTSVKRRFRSDVAVGSSLSGGLDSSLVVNAIDELKKGTGQKQNTFSAVFPGFIKDERKYMDYVTTKCNFTPHYITPTDQGMISSLDKLAFHQEQLFGSASIYLQYCVMQLAKNNTTVLIDGEGADEILAGYYNYYTIFFNELKRRDSGSYYREVAAYNKLISGSTINASVRGNMAQRLKMVMGASMPSIRKAYRELRYSNREYMNSDFYQEYSSKSFKRIQDFEDLNHSLYVSTMVQGLQDLLRYADRNSMAHSREIRLPFLYHELVEFLFSLPSSLKINDGWTKWIMRVAFENRLPSEITWRRDKIGFEPPQKIWMQNNLIKERLHYAKERMVKEGILGKKILNKKEFNSNINMANE